MELTPLADDLWVADEPLHRLGIDFGHRMTVIRGSGGGLVVHSPIAYSDELAAELAALGPVRAVLAPSLFHDLYFPGWLDGYPQARFLCAPGFRAAHPELPFHGDISAAMMADLDAGLQVELIEGMPRVNECVFLHHPSRTLIVADLVFNFDRGFGPWGKFFLTINQVHGRVGCSRLFRLFVRDRARFVASVQRLLDLDFDRVVVGHGTVIDAGGREILRRAYAWLNDP